MERIMELWILWMKDQTTKTIEQLLSLGRTEIEARHKAKSATDAVDSALERQRQAARKHGGPPS